MPAAPNNNKIDVPGSGTVMSGTTLICDAASFFVTAVHNNVERYTYDNLLALKPIYSKFG